MPDLGTDDDRLYTIPGSPPNLLHEKEGDAFAPRNAYALEIDDKLEPPMFKITESISKTTASGMYCLTIWRKSHEGNTFPR